MHIIGGHSDLDPASTAEETAKLGKVGLDLFKFVARSQAITTAIMITV